MLLACGEDGLLAYQEGWSRLPCPLHHPDLLAVDGPRLAVADNIAHVLWTGQRTIHVDSGLEALLLWREAVLTLSGDTDCLTLYSLHTGDALVTTPAGVYPQDMCLLPGGRSLAVCGGADGLLRIIRLPELMEESATALPGSVQRVTCLGGALYTLCALEDSGLQCQLCRIHGGQWEALARWPGLPGAIHADAAGKLWIAATEMLCCLHQNTCCPIPGTYGLIRHLSSRGPDLLATDPILNTLWHIAPTPTPLYEGPVEHGTF